MNPAAFPNAKFRILKRSIRNIGSSTRVSMTGNATRRASPITSAAITNGSRHPIASLP